MLYLKIGQIIPCIFEYKIPRFRRYTRLKPWITTAFLISGRGESEYMRTSVSAVRITTEDTRRSQRDRVKDSNCDKRTFVV